MLSGNVRDLQIHEPAPAEVTAVPLGTILVDQLRKSGYQRIVTFDLVAGFRGLSASGMGAEGSDELLRALGLAPTNGAAPGGVDLLATTLERFVAMDGSPAVLIVDFASRLVVRHEALSQHEHQLFSRALILSHAVRVRPAGPERLPFFNTVIWIVDKEGDLPDWFLITNPRIRHIPIAKPDHLARRSLVPFLIRNLHGSHDAPTDQVEKAQVTFVDETEGLLLLDLNAIVQLARSEGLSIGQISDAVRRYKVGVTEDPWRKIDRAKISGADGIRATPGQGTGACRHAHAGRRETRSHRHRTVPARRQAPRRGVPRRSDRRRQDRVGEDDHKPAVRR